MQILRARMCVLLKISTFFQINVNTQLPIFNSRLSIHFGIVIVRNFIWIFRIKY